VFVGDFVFVCNQLFITDTVTIKIQLY